MSAIGRASKSYFSLRGAVEVLAAVFCVFALQLSIKLYEPPAGSVFIEGPISVERDGSPLGTGRIPLLYSSGSDPGYRPGIYRFGADLLADEKLLATEGQVLVVPQISGSSLELRINGVLLGTRGDPATGRSTVWNAVHVFPLPPGLLGPRNSLELSINGTYEAGIVMRPYFVGGKKVSLRLFTLLFASDYLIWICVGALLIVAFIVLSLGIFDEVERNASLLLGLAGICAAFVLFDFARIERLPIPLVTFKRIVVGARHLSAAILVAVFARFLKGRLGVVASSFIVFQLLCLGIVVLWPGGIVELKRVYGWTYLSFAPFIAYLLYLVVFSGSKVGAFRFLVFGVTFAFLVSVRDIYYLAVVKDAGAVMISQFSFVVLSFCGADFVVGNSSARHRELAAERRRAAYFREESLKDALTEAYNRKILPVLAESLKRPYSVLLIDLDDLKMINDEYGHGTGDAVLVDLVRTFKRNVREDDVVVRMGGDEFAVVLRSCPSKIAYELAELVLADCAKAAVPVVPLGDLQPEALGNLSYSVSIGLAFQSGEGETTLDELLQAVAVADRRLYEAKEGGKGLIASE